MDRSVEVALTAPDKVRVFTEPEWSVRLGIVAALGTTVFVLITSAGATRWGSAVWYLLVGAATGPSAVIIGLRYLIRHGRADPAPGDPDGRTSHELRAAHNRRQRAFAGIALGALILIPVLAIGLDAVAFSQSKAINDSAFDRTEVALAQAMVRCNSGVQHADHHGTITPSGCTGCPSSSPVCGSSLIAVTTSPNWVPLYVGIGVWLLAVATGWWGFFGSQRRRPRSQ